MADPPRRASPSERAHAAASELGVERLTRWCADLLTGQTTWGDPQDPDPGWIGGNQAHTWGSPERLAEREGTSWARVWAARTLLQVWDDRASAAVVDGLSDPAWRVREMCAKVAATWELGAAADIAADLVDEDDVPRVRASALRVLGAVGEHEHLGVLARARTHSEASVRTAAERALHRLAERLDLDPEQVGPP